MPDYILVNAENVKLKLTILVFNPHLRINSFILESRKVGGGIGVERETGLNWGLNPQSRCFADLEFTLYLLMNGTLL